MSQSDSWSDRDDTADAADAGAVAEQMRAATRSLRARLSLVPQLTENTPERREDA